MYIRKKERKKERKKRETDREREREIIYERKKKNK